MAQWTEYDSLDLVIRLALHPLDGGQDEDGRAEGVEGGQLVQVTIPGDIR